METNKCYYCSRKFDINFKETDSYQYEAAESHSAHSTIQSLFKVCWEIVLTEGETRLFHLMPFAQTNHDTESSPYAYNASRMYCKQGRGRMSPYFIIPFLDAFAKMEQNYYYFRHVSPHGTIRLPLHGFSRNFDI
jgi:hypothetical protein